MEPQPDVQVVIHTISEFVGRRGAAPAEWNPDECGFDTEEPDNGRRPGDPHSQRR